MGFHDQRGYNFRYPQRRETKAPFSKTFRVKSHDRAICQFDVHLTSQCDGTRRLLRMVPLPVVVAVVGCPGPHPEDVLEPAAKGLGGGVDVQLSPEFYVKHLTVHPGAEAINENRPKGIRSLCAKGSSPDPSEAVQSDRRDRCHLRPLDRLSCCL